MLGPCLVHAWSMLGPCLVHAWSMLGPCLAHAWSMLGMDSHTRDLGMNSHSFLFWLILDLLTYLYPIFVLIYLSISIYIPFFKPTYLLEREISFMDGPL